jgi:hypothetical protein
MFLLSLAVRYFLTGGKRRLIESLRVSMRISRQFFVESVRDSLASGNFTVFGEIFRSGITGIQRLLGCVKFTFYTMESSKPGASLFAFAARRAGRPHYMAQPSSAEIFGQVEAV